MRQWTDTPIRTASLVFFDLETTGLRPDRGAQITEMAVVGPGGVRFEWTSRSDPPDDARIRAQLPLVVDHFGGAIVVGHNLQFDFRFLTYEAERYGLGGLDVQFIDTLGLARRHLDRRDDYRLGALVAAFDLAPDETLHTAVGDARAARALFWHLVDAGELRTLSDAAVKRLSWNAG